LNHLVELLKYVLTPSPKIVESRNRVGGEGTFVLAGAQG